MPITNEDIWAEVEAIKRDLGSVSEQVTLDSATLANITSILTNTNTTITNVSTVTSNLGYITEDVVTPFSGTSIGAAVAALSMPAPTSGVIGANVAVYVPFALTNTKTAYKMFCYNGATASGNIDVGIYNSAGTRLVSMGATAQSGTNTNQTFNIADTSLAAGQYYMAISFSTTGTVFLSSEASATPAEYFNVRRQASAHPLPATATFDALATGFNLPVFGVALRSDFA